jgi:hypothetical protein
MSEINKTEMENLQSLVDNAGIDGTWNYDPYFHGMFNGMELMLAVIETREPKYREAPSEWISESELTCGEEN